MSSMKPLTELLGGRDVLGHLPSTRDDLVELIRHGLPYRSFEKVAEALDSSVDEVAATLDVPRSNLTRRKKTGLLKKDESEKVLRLARIALRAEEVLGSMEKAYRWLRTPNRALGGQRPMEMLDLEIGAREVEDVLGRIQYGVYG